MIQQEQNKQIVKECYELAINGRNPEEAVSKYFGATYIQHNPLAPDGGEAAVKGFTFILSQMPEMKLEIKRMIAENDLVVVHSHSIPAPGQRGRAVMDIFRLEDGKIVEHWDVAQEVPEVSANNNTMF